MSLGKKSNDDIHFVEFPISFNEIIIVILEIPLQFLDGSRIFFYLLKIQHLLNLRSSCLHARACARFNSRLYSAIQSKGDEFPQETCGTIIQQDTRGNGSRNCTTDSHQWRLELRGYTHKITNKKNFCAIGPRHFSWLKKSLGHLTRGVRRLCDLPKTEIVSKCNDRQGYHYDL